MREITTNQQSKLLMSKHLMNWIIHTNRVSGIQGNRNLQKSLLFIRFLTSEVHVTSHYRNQVLSVTQGLIK